MLPEIEKGALTFKSLLFSTNRVHAPAAGPLLRQVDPLTDRGKARGTTKQSGGFSPPSWLLDLGQAMMWVNFENSNAVRYVPHAGLRRMFTVRPACGLRRERQVFEIHSFSSNLQPCSRSLFSPKTSTAIQRVSASGHPKARLESTADVV